MCGCNMVYQNWRCFFSKNQEQKERQTNGIGTVNIIWMINLQNTIQKLEIKKNKKGCILYFWKTKIYWKKIKNKK